MELIMKKIIPLLFALSMCFVLAACGNNTNVEIAENTEIIPQTSQIASEEEKSVETAETETAGGEQDIEENQSTQQTEKSDVDDTKILIAYFSHTGENYGVGNIEKGNTHIVADMIAEQTGGITFEISTITPYPDAYDDCIEIAKQEQEENARPELAASVENMEDYDVIFLGYPIWWSDMPMAVYTFLESYDFSGKTIVPFCTHEGSGLSSTENSISETCPDSEVLAGFSIKGSVAQNSQDEAKAAVTDWLEETEFID